MSNDDPWEGFVEYLDGDKDLFKDFQNQKEEFERWVFRGQYSSWELKTTLEPACENSGLVKVGDRRKIEDSMIRQFVRLYDGNDRDTVQSDTLYALSLMRHHGAPARLLDFTYSKYVGIYFALEYANDNKSIKDKKCCAIWCINTEWLSGAAKQIPDITRLVCQRATDEGRNDYSFRRLHMSNRFTFVSWENPLGLHRRLRLQQGVFLAQATSTRHSQRISRDSEDGKAKIPYERSFAE